MGLVMYCKSLDFCLFGEFCDGDVVMVVLVLVGLDF